MKLFKLKAFFVSLCIFSQTAFCPGTEGICLINETFSGSLASDGQISIPVSGQIDWQTEALISSNMASQQAPEGYSTREILEFSLAFFLMLRGFANVFEIKPNPNFIQRTLPKVMPEKIYFYLIPLIITISWNLLQAGASFSHSYITIPIALMPFIIDDIIPGILEYIRAHNPDYDILDK